MICSTYFYSHFCQGCWLEQGLTEGRLNACLVTVLSPASTEIKAPRVRYQGIITRRGTGVLRQEACLSAVFQGYDFWEGAGGLH